MSRIKEKPVVVLYSFLNVFMGALIAHTVLVVVLALISAFTGAQLYSVASIPVTLSLPVSFVQSFGERGVSLLNIQGLLMPTPWGGLPVQIIIAALIYTLLENGALLTGIVIIKKILRSLKEGSPFTLENAKRIKVLALMLAVVPAILLVVSLGLVHYQITLQNQTIELKGAGSNITGYLYLSGMLYIIAEVFRKGVQLQEENELTV